MKRMVALLLALVMTCSLCACSGGGSEETTAAAAQTTAAAGTEAEDGTEGGGDGHTVSDDWCRGKRNAEPCHIFALGI